MVKYYHRFRPLQKLRAFRVAWTVRIHHHHDRVAADHLKSGQTVDKHVVRVSLLCSKALHQRPDRAGGIVDDDLRLFAQSTGGTEDTDSRAKRVHIAYTVSHDDDILTALDDLAKGMRLDSRLNAGIALHLLGLAAVVRNLILLLDHDLITASPQCKVNCRTGVLIALVVRGTADSYTDTQGYRHLIADLDRLDILQDAEFVLSQLLQIFIFEYNEIFVFLNLPHQSIHFGKVLVYLTVDQSNQQGTLHVLDAVQCLIIVVNIDQRCHLFLLQILLLIVVQLRLVKEVHRRQELLRSIHL